MTYEQDVAWGEDGTGPSARGGGFSKQAARGRFFQLLQKQRRGGARSAGGGRVIGCVLIFGSREGAGAACACRNGGRGLPVSTQPPPR